MLDRALATTSSRKAEWWVWLEQQLLSMGWQRWQGRQQLFRADLWLGLDSKQQTRVMEFIFFLWQAAWWWGGMFWVCRRGGQAKLLKCFTITRAARLHGENSSNTSARHWVDKTPMRQATSLPVLLILIGTTLNFFSTRIICNSLLGHKRLDTKWSCMALVRARWWAWVWFTSTVALEE